MLKNLKLRNFRAFKSQNFELSRINIFVGPNNSGKSSALSAINLLAQTAVDNDANVPLVLRGRFDDLGTFHDVVHGNNANSLLAVEFGINDFVFHIEYKYRSQRREIEICKYQISDSYGPLYEYAIRGKDNYVLKYRDRPFEELLPGSVKRRPIFYGLRAFDQNINFSAVREKGEGLTPAVKATLTEVERLVRHAFSSLVTSFRMFDSLSPFREPPTRTYLFSGAAPAHVGRTGSNAIDMLVNDNFKRGREKTGLVEYISRWFAQTGMATKINVRALTSRHYEVCVRGADGRDHNLCDVGFGCSQVLPVLIGGLNMGLILAERLRSDLHPIFLVQEPEIHLHPNAQAELGTFFAELFKSRGQVLIETHSSNLIIRIQRHVAEGMLKPSDVKIFYVSGGEVPPPVTVMEMDEHGIFKTAWPGGFFPQRQEESLALARASHHSRN